MPIYQHSFEVHAPLSKVAAFHDDPASLSAITPPPVRVTVERFDAPVQVGSQVIFTLHIGPIGAWSHTHTFTTKPGVNDRVEYQRRLVGWAN